MKIVKAAVRRLLEMGATLLVVYTITFFLMRAVPGGPFSSEKNLPESIKRNIEARYGLDKPLVQQYFTELSRACVGDFGPSYKLADYNVEEVLAEGFPISASLGIIALVIAIFVGMLLGSLAAMRRNTLVDQGLMAAATIGIAVPNFVLASGVIIVFVFWLQAFPAGGWGTVRQLILPACCLAAPFAAYIARLTRAGMLEVLHQDYIRTAYAKGLSERDVVLRHAIRGGLLPVVSYLGPATAYILTGALVLEQIFNLPGMGSHFVEAALQRDYTLAMGAVMIYTFLLCVMNILVDLAYTFIDPRVKIE
jgi:oligopeptide transport system permease protein